MNKRLLQKTLILSCFTYLICALVYNVDMKSYTSFEGIQAYAIEPKEENHKFNLRDRIDLAWQQEIDMTMDPNTGTVPRERLLIAQDTLRSRQERNSRKLRTAASIVGINWAERGPNNTGGRTRAIWVDLNDATKKTVWVGSVGGGIWKTTDITAAAPLWVPGDQFLSNMAVTCITQNPTNTQELYLGTGEGYGNADAIRGLGIYKSTDGGATWSLLPTTFFRVSKLKFSAAGVLFASTSTGLFRSTNGGTSFTKVLGTGLGITGAGSNTCYDIEIASNGEVYASLSNSVHKSTNAGVTFGAALPITAGSGRIELSLALSDANYVYVLTETPEILLSTNAGVSFTATSLPADADGGIPAGDFTRSQSWYDLEITVDPNNREVAYVGGVDLFKTTNAGSSWQQIAHWYGGFGFQDVHADQHIIYFEPGNSSVIYFGNDGGIYRTANSTAAIPTITYKSAGYRSLQFYGCAIHPTSGSNVALAGAQDNGSHRFSTAGLGATVEVTGGDGAFCNIDQDQPQYMFTQYVYNNYRRSTNGGTTFTNVNFNNNGQFINPSDYDNTANHLYAAEVNGSYTYWSNPQTGSTFTATAVTAFGGAKVTSVTCSDATQDLVFFGLDNADVVKVASANTATPTATNISTGLPASGSVSCVALERGNENHMLVTYSNYGVNSVWESTNGGTSWTSVEGNLPDMPVRSAMFNPNNAAQAIVATELGVWSTDLLNAGTTNWGPSNTGLANVRTDMLQWRTSDNTVIASTHGRGLFSTTIFSPTPVTWLNFNARQVANHIALDWATGSEHNNKGFDVERSEEGKNFTVIGQVVGAVNSKSIQHYLFKDNNVQPGKKYFYKIKQVDIDGHFDYTNIVVVNMNQSSNFEIDKLYPNPFNNQLQVSFGNAYLKGITIDIKNASGKTVYLKKDLDSTQEIVLDLHFLPAGNYFFTALHDGNSRTKQIIKIQ